MYSNTWKAEEEKDPANAKTPPLDADIRFEDVTFCYEGAKPVLDHLSFTIPAGKTFAVLGGTGSGKSTMMHLLDRLYDPKGRLPSAASTSGRFAAIICGRTLA